MVSASVAFVPSRAAALPSQSATWSLSVREVDVSSEIEIDGEGPSRQVLAEVPGRALRFLSAAGKNRQIRALLRERGYTDEDHREGWELLHRASGFGTGEPDEVEDAEVGKAVAELDAWDEPYFRFIRAALLRRHPAQEKFVFDNLTAQAGAAAVVSVKTLLDRLDALEKSPKRKATRKEDHAALETIAKRGITKEERSRLRQLVDIASGGGAAAEEGEGAEDGGAERAVIDSQEHLEALRALHAWYREWSETARAFIKRRDFLVRLGLAHRKMKVKVKPSPAAPPAPDVL
ncbi:hypothetical protein SCE1572_12285 [Sorangium cellulosum So0157-2]|uniref:Uncharacterized protein n=1 Tax=Sorangium cellulosum So0157-2 TaxID=1254432 RepID=S4XTI9_SORCE|nr:hypothetical protein SCE1572_12285 [Sorangium cellulosum So0157-2]